MISIRCCYLVSLHLTNKTLLNWKLAVVTSYFICFFGGNESGSMYLQASGSISDQVTIVSSNNSNTGHPKWESIWKQDILVSYFWMSKAKRVKNIQIPVWFSTHDLNSEHPSIWLTFTIWIPDLLISQCNPQISTRLIVMIFDQRSKQVMYQNKISLIQII